MDKICGLEKHIIELTKNQELVKADTLAIKKTFSKEKNKPKRTQKAEKIESLSASILKWGKKISP
ncbi:hypothetical protein DRW42_24485 [Pedobacter miscanthi]|uniref:Uncharacterized protein n=2 Tax=Pedobacter miscanthi TaxID=2259170 RepID=A0A366KM83_9SPHI|nr:hypothetical protein DRW42_24485 [Pedobacter miscanthi]